MVAKGKQRGDGRIGYQPHVAASATVAAVRAASWSVGFAPERHCPRASVASFDAQ